MDPTSYIQITHKACSGCGLCVSDCPTHVLALQNEKAVVAGDGCLQCGHCFAICPTGAVAIQGGLGAATAQIEASHRLDADRLHAHMSMRRSIRQYKQAPVSRALLEQVVEAGRLTPSGSNAQNVRYIVVQDEIDSIEDAVLAQYRKLSKWIPLIRLFAALPGTGRYNFERGFLFHHAPAAILIVSESTVNAGLAAMSMELMAEALGLGTLYVGLFSGLANYNRALRKSLGLKRREKIVTCLAMGYSAVQYRRPAPKREARAIWR